MIYKNEPSVINQKQPTVIDKNQPPSIEKTSWFMEHGIEKKEPTKQLVFYLIDIFKK